MARSREYIWAAQTVRPWFTDFSIELEVRIAIAVKNTVVPVHLSINFEEGPLR